MDRKKLLLLVLAVIALGYGGDWIYRHWIQEPFEKLETRRTKLDKDGEVVGDRLRQARNLVQELPSLEDRSLPANPQRARQAYQAWCWRLLKKHEILNSSVEVSQPRPRALSPRSGRGPTPPPDLHEFGVTIRGTTTLQGVIDLLDEFYQTDFLHRIDAVNLTPLNLGRQLSFTMTISALSLRTATETDKLPGQVTDPRLLVDADGMDAMELEEAMAAESESAMVHASVSGMSDEESSATADLTEPATAAEALQIVRDDSTPVSGQPPGARSTQAVQERPWQEIVKRNVFAAGGGMTIAKSIKLSAITEDTRGVRQAWFRNGQSKTQIVDQGQTFRQGVLVATVVELDEGNAYLLIEGDRVRVSIGQSLADGVALVPK